MLSTFVLCTGEKTIYWNFFVVNDYLDAVDSAFVILNDEDGNIIDWGVTDKNGLVRFKPHNGVFSTTVAKSLGVNTGFKIISVNFLSTYFDVSGTQYLVFPVISVMLEVYPEEFTHPGENVGMLKVEAKDFPPHASEIVYILASASGREYEWTKPPGAEVEIQIYQDNLYGEGGTAVKIFAFAKEDSALLWGTADAKKDRKEVEVKLSKKFSELSIASESEGEFSMSILLPEEVWIPWYEGKIGRASIVTFPSLEGKYHLTFERGITAGDIVTTLRCVKVLSEAPEVIAFSIPDIKIKNLGVENGEYFWEYQGSVTPDIVYHILRSGDTLWYINTRSSQFALPRLPPEISGWISKFDMLSTTLLKFSTKVAVGLSGGAEEVKTVYWQVKAEKK